MSIGVKTTWLCDICKDYRNLGKCKECNSCGAARKKSRYAVVIDGAFYLCHLYTLKHTQLLSVLKVMPPEENVMKVSYPSDADITYDVVVKMARRALEPPAPRLLLSAAEPKEKDESGSASPVREDSLFQRVMDEGTKLAYDSKIGRFVPVDTVEVSPHKSKKKRDIAVVNTDLNYVKFMAQEKRVMKKVVQETIAIRSKLEKEEMVLPTFENSAWRPCALCERSLPQESLPGEISFKSVADWRAQHGAPIPDSDHRFDALNLYSKAPLCLFCTQFFDGELAEVLEKGAEEIKSVKNLPKFGGAVEDTTQVRPLSSIGRSMEISNLKMRSMRSKVPLSIGTSSSVSVLEVKVKTALSMAKINSDLHLYQLREDRILKKIYQKRRKEFPNLSLDEFKLKLFEWANDSLLNPPKPESNLAGMHKSPSGQLLPVEAAEAEAVRLQRARARKMSLPEIFLAAATNSDFRLMADPKFLRKRQSVIGGPEEEDQVDVKELKKRTCNYDPSKDFMPTKTVATEKAKSASSLSRPKVSLSSKMKLEPVKEASGLKSVVIEKRQSKSRDEAGDNGGEDVRASWMSLLSKGSPVKQDPLDENDPFALPKLVVKGPTEKSRRAHPAPRVSASSSAKSLTRKSEGVPVKPPQSEPLAAKSDPATDEPRAQRAPEWRTTTDANGVFAPVRLLKLREMSKPENQAKPESPKKTKKQSKSRKKKILKGASEEKSKRLAAERMNQKLLADRRQRKEKARGQVQEAAGAYSGPGEDTQSTMRSLGFELEGKSAAADDSGAPRQSNRSTPAVAQTASSGGTPKRAAKEQKKAVSFKSEASPEALEALRGLPRRPVQRTGSGLVVARTLRRTDSQKFLDELAEGSAERAASPDVFVSREGVSSRSKAVSWEESMYNDSFEDVDGTEKEDEFSSGYYADDFEAQQSFADEGYEPDFEPESRAVSFMEEPAEEAAPSIWGHDLPPRALSSHRRQRGGALQRAYSEEEFEPIEDPPSDNEYDGDDQGYSSQEFEDTQGYSSQEFEEEDGEKTGTEGSRSGLNSAEYGRPSTSRRSSRGDFVNTMRSVGSRAFSPAKTPLSSHRKKRRSAGVVGAMDSPLQSRPSSSVSLRALSPDKARRALGPSAASEQALSRFRRFDSKRMFDEDLGSKQDPELEAAMQEYVDMLFSGDGVDEIVIEDELGAPNAGATARGDNPGIEAAPERALDKQLDSPGAKKGGSVDVLVDVSMVSPPPKKFNPILPREVVVTTTSSPGTEKKSEEAFEGMKTTRSGAVLPRIAHDIRTFPSQLDLTIMRRSGEIGKKIEEKEDEDDALLAAVANRLKNITGTSTKGMRKL